MVKKLLISYSDDDRDVALKLRQTLLDAGHEVWMALEDLKGSVLWTQAILDAIDDAEGMVLLWSPSAAGSKQVLEEVRIARVFLKPIFPILAHQMTRIPPLPEVIGPLQIINDANIDTNLAELMRRLSDDRKHNINYPLLDAKVYMPKPRNPYFVGRTRELKALFVDILGFHRQNRVGLPIAISGLAGIGKTQLALTFAYRFNLFFEHGVYWIDAPNGIVQEFEKLGNYLGIKRLRDERPFDYARRVYDRLSQLDNGLIVFDNVTDIREFHEWCPVGSKSCSVILTTRKSPRGFAVRVINLTELDADSAYRLIVSRKKDSEKLSADAAQQQALQRICNIVGNHPLALEWCACYLQSDFVLPADFLHDLEEDPLGHLASNPQFHVFLDMGNVNLLNVLAKDYNSLNRELVDPYFLLMCWFAPRGINTDLIRNAYGKPREGTQALDELAENSVICRDTQKTVSLHPLVAQFGKYLAKTSSADYHKKFVEVIVEFLQTNKDNLSSEQVRAELPHVFEAVEVSREYHLWNLSAQLHEYCAEIVVGIDTRIELLEKAYEIIKDKLPELKRRLPSICVRLGKARGTKGQLKDALTEFSKAETLYSAFSEVDPAEIASLQFELGNAHLALGQYEEARKYLTRALDTALNLAHYDVTAPEVTQIKQALARRDLLLGNFNEAEKSFNEILTHREKFHANRPDAESSAGVGSSFADLSQLALERGNYKEAITAAEKALAVIREYHKANDPACGNLLLLLGNIHYQSGNYRLAKEQMERSQHIFLSTFGDKHPSYARTLIALSEANRRLAEFGPALEKAELAIKILENRFGVAHPSVAVALGIKGKIHHILYQLNEEEMVWKKILDIQSRVYSDNHPASASTHYGYGNLFLRKGEFAKAQEQLEKSLGITEKSLGTKHPEYFGRLIGLATCYNEQENYSAALERLREAHGLQKDIFGESPHPSVARMLQLQSEVDRRLENFKEALASIDKALKMKEEIYGHTHPSVADALEVLAKIYYGQHKLNRFKTILDQTFLIREKAYGASHPLVGNTLHGFALFYLQKGHCDAAINNFKRALEISQGTFGKNHPEYIERSMHLANAYYQNNDYDRALKQLDENIAVVENLDNGLYSFASAHRVLRGKIYLIKGRHSEALQEFNHAIVVDPQNAAALAERGNFYRIREQWNEAWIDYEKANDIDKSYEWLFQWIQSALDTDKERTNQSHHRIIQLLLQKLGIEESTSSVRNISFGSIDAYAVDFGKIFKRFNYLKSIPIMFLPGSSFTDKNVNDIIGILRAHIGSKSTGRIGIVVSFLDSHNSVKFEQILKSECRSSAFDVLVLVFDDAKNFAEQKRDVRKYFRHLVLSKVNLSSLFRFVTRGPSTNLFVGREKELREVVEHISTSSFAITGGRLIGKTSMLRILHLHRLPNTGFRSLYLDCSAQRSRKSFLMTPLVDWMPDTPSNKTVSVEMIAENSTDLKKDKPLVLLLDEADKLVPIDREEHWRIFNALRALVTSGYAQIVFCGELLLIEALHDQSSPMYNFAREILLRPLDYHSVKELVLKPFSNLEITFDDEDEIVKRIYNFTGGHPNIVQRLCDRLLEVLNENGSRNISFSHLDRVIQDPRFQEFDFLAVYWDRAHPLEKILSIILSKVDGPYNPSMASQLLNKIAKLRITQKETKDAMDRLVELRSILKKTQDGYTYNVTSFPEIIANSFVFAEQLEVIIEEYNDSMGKTN